MRKVLLSLTSVAFLGACVGLSACTTVPAGDGTAEDALDTSGSELTLADVQAAIAASGAKWNAGTNSVAALPHNVRQAMLGVPASDLLPEDMRVVTESPSPTARQALPATYDWRNVDGKNYVSPILDQGRCGSCVAFSSVATFETQLNIAAKDTSSPWQLSPQYLFSCGGGACSFGWQPGSAARFLVSKGVVDNSCMPYSSGPHGDDASCSAACSDASSRTVKAHGYSTPTSGASNVDAVKRALQNGPLVASFTVYEDFMFYTGGVYKHVTGGVAGGHAVSIVGWNDTDKAWVVRNSWGTGWGLGGFFEIAWDDEGGLGSQTWGFDVPAPGPYVSINGMRDGMLLSGQSPLAFDVQAIGNSPISWTLQSGTAMAAQGNASGSSAMLDTTTVADGVYTIQAHAGAGAARVDGPRHTVSVLNGTATGNVKFKTLTAGQTLSGTATWDVTLASAPVPATQVDWTITNAAGQVVVKRTTTNTGPLMQLGWNTTKWPNGAYTVAITASVGSQPLQGQTLSVNVRN
jgi:C1A family cysteine protease